MGKASVNTILPPGSKDQGMSWLEYLNSKKTVVPTQTSTSTIFYTCK